LALNFENAARNIVDLLNPKYLTDSAVAKILNAVLDTVLTEEYSAENAQKIVGDMNRTLQEAEVDKLLVKPTSDYNEAQFDKIINDCIKDLTERYRKNDFQNRLNEYKQKGGSSQEEQIRLLSELIRKADK
jgi:hypothetical protein